MPTKKSFSTSKYLSTYILAQITSKSEELMANKCKNIFIFIVDIIYYLY